LSIKARNSFDQIDVIFGKIQLMMIVYFIFSSPSFINLRQVEAILIEVLEVRNNCSLKFAIV